MDSSENDVKFSALQNIAYKKIGANYGEIREMKRIQNCYEEIIMSIKKGDNILSDLYSLFEYITDYSVEIKPVHLAILLQLYYKINSAECEEEEEDDIDETMDILSAVISEILTSYPDELVDVAIRGRIIPLIISCYPDNHLSNFMPPLIRKSYTAAKLLIESGIIDKMRPFIEDVENYDSNTVMCIGEFGNYPEFFEQLVPFVPFLLDNYLHMATDELQQASSKVINQLFKNPEIRDQFVNDSTLNEIIELLLSWKEEYSNLQTIEYTFEIIGSCIGADAVSQAAKTSAMEILIGAFVHLFDGLEASNVSTIEVVIESLIRSIQAVPGCIDALYSADVIAKCFSSIDIDFSVSTKTAFIRLLLTVTAFGNVSQIAQLINDGIIDVIANHIGSMRDTIKAEFLLSVQAICVFLSTNFDEDIYAQLTGSEAIEEAVEALTSDSDGNISERAEEVQRLLNFIDDE